MIKNWTLFFLLLSGVLYSQNTEITGTVKDNNNKPLSFATVLVYEIDAEKPIKGAITNEDGNFVLLDLALQEYRITFSFIGYATKEQEVLVSLNKNLGEIVLSLATEELDETIVRARLPSLEKVAGKLTFKVENTSLSTGSAFDLLKKTPGVLIIGDRITIKSARPIIYINDKRVYLSSAELASLLNSMDASVIKEVEVITNPSAKYDAEAGSVLNIITSKAISIGYKGSVNGTYEQAIYPKYRIGTTHFYKNNWLSFYAGYSFSPRKEYKQDDNYTRFFNPNGSTKSIWLSDFNRTTKLKSHQANVIADFMLSDKSSLSISSNILVSPNKKFQNNVDAEIFDAQQKLDSTFVTKSNLENDKSNLSFNVEYESTLGENGTEMSVATNYISYNNEQFQEVSTDYFLPDGTLIRNNSFFTLADQNSDIFTGQVDFTFSIFSGTLESGVKYSNIDTQSGLAFFDSRDGGEELVDALSDIFVYKESIYAAYFNFVRSWDNWELNVGLRGEQIDVRGDSKALGEVNNQEYFELFPTASIQHNLNDQNTLGISYARRIQRPRYESLNPFFYFLNENSFHSGNPNLVPAIENKITLSYSYNNQWFLDLYYQEFDSALSVLTFQDNENSRTRYSDANLITEFQYSMDLIYISSLTPWWYLSMVTSTYYLENEFYSVESVPETYSNSTFGFYAQMYSGLTLSKEHSLKSDISAVYISNLIYGSSDYANQFMLSISFRKEFWDKTASINIGVDDIFNSYNVPVVSKYYNQDNSYLPNSESRLFKIEFKYWFGNAKLRENIRLQKTVEAERLD